MDALTDLEQAYVDACDRGDDAEMARLEPLVDAEVNAAQARLRAPDALAKTALWYAKQGIPVFPLQPACPHPVDADWDYRCPRHGGSCGKVPFPGTRGFKDASRDPAIVRAWWTANPRANIGTPTGIAFDVIDIDGPTGVASVLAICPSLDQIGPPILGRTLTPRGGGHHLFVPATGRGNKAAVYTGVDYRGLGGYVVLPPSVGGNGRLYKWLQPLDLAAIASGGGDAA